MNEVTGPVSSTCAIELQGLTRSFGAHHVLRGIDLKVNTGERLAIFGPNGAGKTTLIKIIATIIRPSSGTVLINGTSIRDKPEQIRSRLGVMGHYTFLYDNLTVYDNLKFYGRMYGVNNLDRAVREVIARVELESRLYDRVGTLSRGMQQRVSLARAIIHSPSILFMDEPEAGLDPRAVSVMQGILDTSGNARNTVLFTTHNIERGLELCDRLAILSEGKIVYQGLKEEIDTANFKSVYDRYTGLNK
jgi:ABC-type multidrug transport system ATPase subunit